jgi:hypothetical protein
MNDAYAYAQQLRDMHGDDDDEEDDESDDGSSGSARPMHPAILNAIARLDDPQHQDERHTLFVDASAAKFQLRMLQLVGRADEDDEGTQMSRCVDRRSLEHLVEFLDTGTHSVTELHFLKVALCASLFESGDDEDDGGLNVLRELLAEEIRRLPKLL